MYNFSLPVAGPVILNFFEKYLENPTFKSKLVIWRTRTI